MIRPLLISCLTGLLGISPAEPQSPRALAPGEAVRDSLAAGGIRSWQLTLREGQFIAAEIHDELPDLTVRLLDPEGNVVRAWDLQETVPEPARIEWPCTASGNWTLQLEAADPEAGGSYAILWAVAREATQADRKSWEAELEDQKVVELLRKGDVDGALALARQAVAARRDQLGDDPAGLAGYLHSLGEKIFDAPTVTAQGWEEAESLLKESLGLRERLGGEGVLRLADTLDTLSTLYFHQGRWEEAEQLQLRLLRIRRDRLGEADPLVAQSLNSLGVISIQQGRYTDAEPYLAEALELQRAARPSDPARLADSLNSLAELHRSRDNFPEAEAFFKEAIARAEEAGKSAPQMARLLNNLAGLYKDAGRYDQAQALLLRSLRIRESAENPDRLDLATAFLNMAELHRLQGNVADAQPLYRKALDLARVAMGPDNPNLVWFINQIAVFYQEEERLDEAEALYREAMALLERSLGSEHLIVAQTLHDLAGLLRLKGSHAEAERLSLRGLAIRRQALGDGHPDVALSLIDLARTVAAKPGQRGVAALELVEEAISILGETTAYPEARTQAYALRAELRWHEAQPAAAIADMEEAVRQVEGIRPHSGGGEATRAGFLGKHLDHFNRLVGWLLEDGQVERAFEYLEKGRGRALLDQLAAAGVEISSGIPEPARSSLEARERAARSRLAEFQQRVTLARSRADLPRQERSRLIQSSEAELSAAALEYRQVYEEIRNASPLWKSSSGGDPVSLAAAQRELIPPGARMLIYQIGRDQSHLTLMPPAPRRPEFLRLSVSEKAAAALGISPGPLTSAGLRKALVGDGRGSASGRTGGLLLQIAQPPLSSLLTAAEGNSSFEQPDPGARLHALWEVLLPPGWWRRLRNASEVILVPDGLLHQLPFEALVVKPGARPGTTRYWLDQGPPIRYATSATLLRELERRADRASRLPSPAYTLLSVSDPVYDPAQVASPQTPRVRDDPDPIAASPRTKSMRPRGPLPRLAGTAREAAEILRHFSAAGHEGRVRVLQGGSADEKNVRAALSGNRYIHLATHGIVDQERGDLFAALALTPPPSETTQADNDGFLHLFEIYDLDLECDLAVLSACASQAGRHVEGEGVFALSRGFVAAGARRVVASHWPVDDQSTATLMGEFFGRIAAGHKEGLPIPFARALLDAKRAVRGRPEWASPHYWAPFVLTGIR